MMDNLVKSWIKALTRNRIRELNGYQAIKDKFYNDNIKIGNQNIKVNYEDLCFHWKTLTRLQADGDVEIETSVGVDTMEVFDNYGELLSTDQLPVVPVEPIQSKSVITSFQIPSAKGDGYGEEKADSRKEVKHIDLNDKIFKRKIVID